MTKTKQKHPTIRISAETHQTVKQLAEEKQVSMADLVAEAVERYRRERIAQHANKVWAEAMKDPELRQIWKEEDEDIEMTFWTPIEEPWEGDLGDEHCQNKEE